MSTTGEAQQLHPRALAHLGDAVYELHIRQKALRAVADQPEKLHKWTIARANAEFQTRLLEALTPLLTEAEQEIVRRARNIPVSAGRRSNQAMHRLATAFEALIGATFLGQPARLDDFWHVIDPLLSELET